MSSAHFFTGLFVFQVWSLVSSLYILDTSPLSDTPFANIFSHSISCLLVLLIVSFAVQNHFILMRSQYFTFAFVSLALGDVSSKKLLQPMSMGLHLCSPSGFWWFPVSHVGLSSILNLLLCAMSSGPVFPAPFVKETVCFPLDILSCFVKD